MKRILLALCSTLALLLPATSHAAPAFPVTVTDDLGNRVHIPARPARIVSLDPRDTETLFALGLESRVVGDGGQDVEGAAGINRPFHASEWPSPWGRDYPVRAKQLTHVEGGFGNTPFNVETVVSLHPNLIISLKSDLQTLQKMRDMGYPVIVLDPTTIQGIYRDIALVGKATGAAPQAAVVIGNMKRELRSVRRHLKNVQSRPRVFYEIDATNPTQPYAAGPGTFIDDAIHLAAARNVLDGITTPGCPGSGCYPQVDLEDLIKTNPQIILLGDAAYGTTVSSVQSRAGWSSIQAVRTGRIYPFDDELISRAGPRIMIGIRDMAKLIHPGAFR